MGESVFERRKGETGLACLGGQVCARHLTILSVPARTPAFAQGGHGWADPATSRQMRQKGVHAVYDTLCHHAVFAKKSVD